MKRDPIKAAVLATKLIPNVDPDLAKELDLTPDQRSLGLITSDCDDVTYTALDEATKKADVKVVYAKSFYAGAANANTKLAGEIIGILAGPNPAEVKSGLDAAVDFIEPGILHQRERRRFDRLLCALHLPHGQLPFGRCRNRRGRGARVSDRSAARGDVRRRCCAQSGRCFDVRPVRPSIRDELRRCSPDG